LYNKEYSTAFGSSGEQGEEFRKVYFARWTPARAVLYERAFQECKLGQLLGWQDDLDEKEDERVRNERRFRNKIEGTSDDSIGNDDDEKEEKQFRVIMIGSGAGAELLALGSILGESSNTTTSSRPRITIQAIDQGNWGELVDKMNSGMKSQWSTSLNSSNFNLQFHQTDLLSSSSNSNNESESLDLSSPDLKLVTILFTITELLLQSRSSTLRFLSNLTNSAPKGLNLLIIESASLALIPIGTNGRTYPLGQLLDHALGGGGKWEILKSEETKWFRMPLGAEDVYNNDDNDDNNGGSSSKGIRVKLENSRVVLRLYRKL
jgi:25S rRNA (uracil2843-N3)-methyltransferase